MELVGWINNRKKDEKEVTWFSPRKHCFEQASKWSFEIIPWEEHKDQKTI